MRDDGGPAFPRPASEHTELGEQNGMSLRDYFAAKAMQGELSAQFANRYEWSDQDKLSVWVYAVADAMLEVRKK